MVDVDVTDDASLDAAVLQALATPAGTRLDFLVHAIAFSDKSELTGRFLEHQPGELQANSLDISAYSLD